MCGISGAFSNKVITSKLLQDMNDIIRHRGPNDEGYLVFERDTFSVFGGNDTPYSSDSSTHFDGYIPRLNIRESYSSGNLFIGHRRLSIIDLTVNGHQPMCNETHDYWISYNGEIYNFKEIKKELIDLGYSFFTNSDTEVFLKAFHAWGYECQNKFIGMWAASIYVANSHKLYLLRDRFGIKPLYYWISPNGVFHFSSEIKQFTASQEWTPRLNIPRALDYLIFNGLTDHTVETLFEGVKQVGPGSLLEIDLFTGSSLGFSYKEVKWYQPQISSFSGDYKDAVVKFKNIFQDSISIHMISDVEVGFALSGGLDSSSIVCSASNASLETGINNITTFSAVSADEEYSEHLWIDKVTSHLKNVNAIEVSPTPKDMLAQFESMIWTLDEPYQSQSAFFGNQIFKSASESNVKVLLNGQGADEYLSCYGSYNFLRKRQLSLKELIKEIYVQSANAPIFLKNLFGFFSNCIYNKSNFLRSYLFQLKYSFRMIKSTISDKAFRHYAYPYKNINFGSHIDISTFQLHYDALPRYLRWEDRNSMNYSVEARVPFLDHRLVEFSHSLPLVFLDSNDTAKRLLVDAMVGILPESIRNRKDKKGFITPEEKWFKTDFRDELRDMLVKAVSYSKGFVEPQIIEHFDEMISGKKQFDLYFWRVIVFGYWMQEYSVEVEVG